MKLDTAAQELHRKLGRSPSPKELGAELELSEEEVLEAMEAASAYDAVSLEQQQRRPRRRLHGHLPGHARHRGGAL